MNEQQNYDPAIWNERENASSLTEVSLSNYVAHRRIILRKLELTQKAVLEHEKRKALSAAKNFFEKAKIWLSFDASNSTMFKMWGEVIQVFTSRTVFESDLYDIDKLLDLTPMAIKVLLKEYQDADNKYKKLISEFNEAEYLQAKKRIEKIQKHYNPLTGLSGEEYLSNSDLLRQLKALMFEKCE